MNAGDRITPRSRSRASRSALLAGALWAAGLFAGCTTPGAIAPSTIPISGKVVPLGQPETASSCGYTIFTIPLWNPDPVADVTADMIKSKGGDALIEVTSSSSVTYYLVGVANCFEIRGTVVKLAG